MPRYFNDYRLPATQHEFQVMLEELDLELGALGVPPPFRGLKAMGLVAQRCQIGLELPLTLTRFRGHPNRRDNAPGGAHVTETTAEVHGRIQG